MKKILLTVLMMLAIMASAQVTKTGNIYKASKGAAIRDTLVTSYIYEDAQGKKHKIIINKKTGSCYYWRTSKLGKNYRQYLGKEISEDVCKCLGLKYTAKSKK